MSQLFPAWGSVSNRLQLGIHIGGQHHQNNGQYIWDLIMEPICPKHWRWCSGLFRVRVCLELRADQRPSISRRDFSQSGGEGERWSAFFLHLHQTIIMLKGVIFFRSVFFWNMDIECEVLQGLVNFSCVAVGSNKYPSLPIWLSLSKSC